MIERVIQSLKTLELPVLLWPLLFGLGAYLLLTSQPLGRPKPDLAEQLSRLDVDERVRAAAGYHKVQPFFASRLLERLLRPILDDVGNLLRAVLGRFGLGGGDLEQKLRLARPGVDVPQFFGEKVLCGLIGLAFFPLMNAFRLHPAGPWPFWTWIMAMVVGAVLPDLELNRRLAQRRTLVLMELPTILDMLTIAASAGLALEQAIVVVAGQSRGVVAQELQSVMRELALGSRTLVEALEAMATRNSVPELTVCVNGLRAAHDQGLPVVPTLIAQVETLRERKRLRIIEEGGKATVRMLLPVALFILPVLFIVLLVPAVMHVMALGG